MVVLAAVLEKNEFITCEVPPHCLSRSGLIFWTTGRGTLLRARLVVPLSSMILNCITSRVVSYIFQKSQLAGCNFHCKLGVYCKSFKISDSRVSLLVGVVAWLGLEHLFRQINKLDA